MYVRMKKIVGGAALSLALLVNSAPTWAGAVRHDEVGISNDQAWGAVSAARYSSDKKQYIGCIITASASATRAACFAADKNGTTLTCSTTNPRLTETVRAITNYSYLYFYTQPGSSECSNVELFNYSTGLK